MLTHPISGYLLRDTLYSVERGNELEYKFLLEISPSMTFTTLNRQMLFGRFCEFLYEIHWLSDNKRLHLESASLQEHTNDKQNSKCRI